jgi:hypothetical protein
LFAAKVNLPYLGIGQKEKTKQNLGLTFKFGVFIADKTRELIVVSFCL